MVFLTLGCKNNTHEFTEENNYTSTSRFDALESIKSSFDSGSIIGSLNPVDLSETKTQVINRTTKSVTNYVSKSNNISELEQFDFTDENAGAEPDDKKDRLQIEWDYESFKNKLAYVDTFAFVYQIPTIYDGREEYITWVTEVAPSRGKFVSDCGDLPSNYVFNVKIYVKFNDGIGPKSGAYANDDRLKRYVDESIIEQYPSFWYLTNMTIRTIAFPGRNYIGFMGYDARKGVEFNPNNLVAAWILDVNTMLGQDQQAIQERDLRSTDAQYSGGTSTDVYTWITTACDGAIDVDISSFLSSEGLSKAVNDALQNIGKTPSALANAYYDYSMNKSSYYDSGISSYGGRTGMLYAYKKSPEFPIDNVSEIPGFNQWDAFKNSEEYAQYSNNTMTNEGVSGAIAGAVGGIASSIINCFNFSNSKLETQGGESWSTNGFGRISYKRKYSEDFLKREYCKVDILKNYLSWMFKNDLNGVDKDNDGIFETEPLPPDKLFDKYGTHLILDAVYGGKMTVDYTFEKGYEYTYNELNTMVKKWGGADSDTSTSTDGKSKEVEEKSELSATVYGGEGAVAIVSTLSDYVTALSGWSKTVDSNSAIFIDSPDMLSKQNEYTGIWNYADKPERRSEIYLEYVRVLCQYYTDTIFEAYGNVGTYLGDIQFGTMNRYFSASNAKIEMLSKTYESTFPDNDVATDDDDIAATDDDIDAKYYTGAKVVVSPASNQLINFADCTGKTSNETFCAGLYTALPSRALRGVAFTSVRGSNNFMTHANEFKRKYGYDELTEKDIDVANYRLGKWYMCKDNPSDTQIWKSWEDTIRRTRDDDEKIYPIIECSIFDPLKSIEDSGWKTVTDMYGNSDRFYYGGNDNNSFISIYTGVH